jgi:superfamily II DNA or RNA helicase
LEIGYDVPEVGIEIILASTSNMNQIVQRIGRIVRKYEGKKKALIYVIHLSETKDDDILELIRTAVESSPKITTGIAAYARKREKELTCDNEEEGDAGSKEGREGRLRTKRAYNILESNANEPMILLERQEQQRQDTTYNQKLFQIRSSKQKDKYYQVNAETKTCSCPDFKFNNTRCKHIIATELMMIYHHQQP